MWASAHAGEKACDVIAHWRQAFAVLGIPSAIKTDNGPAYTSQMVQQFLQLWGVSHKLGIPHSPTGAHGTLKRVLQKQKQGMQGETPHSRLQKALYTINHLTVPQNSSNPVFLNHHLSLQASDETHQPRAKVRVRNLVTKQWEGPYDLIASGRGYACVSTDTGVRWVPAKCVRPDLRPQRQNLANRQPGDRDQHEGQQVEEPLSDDSDVELVQTSIAFTDDRTKVLWFVRFLVEEGSPQGAGVVPCRDLVESINWLVLKNQSAGYFLKIDTQLNHLEELNTPLWKNTFKNEQSPGKALFLLAFE
ncbi:hypothetical protein HGM15179_007165 [Zosterops borbonicus]|uniref:Integrase n=1 Tax=Zosterops borbonicus TaxID=364589 RepID=A0A8K1GJD2_9PASS|nr:hypothetical protein HGM15179_007165 [Zosterops borbonicus]